LFLFEITNGCGNFAEIVASINEWNDLSRLTKIIRIKSIATAIAIATSPYLPLTIHH